MATSTIDASSSILKAFTKQSDAGNTNLSEQMFTVLAKGLPSPPSSSPISEDELNKLASLVNTSTTDPDIPEVSSITNGSNTITNPTGIFDILMQAVIAHLDNAYTNDRISLSEYATIFATLINTALTQAVKFSLEKDTSYWNAINARNKAVTALIEAAVANATLASNASQAYGYQATYALNKAKLATEDATYAYTEQKIQTEAAQERVYDRQVEAFNENFKEKALKIMLDAWGVGFSVSQDALYALDDPSKAIPIVMTSSEIDSVWRNFFYPSTVDKTTTLKQKWTVTDSKGKTTNTRTKKTYSRSTGVDTVKTLPTNSDTTTSSIDKTTTSDTTVTSAKTSTYTYETAVKHSSSDIANSEFNKSGWTQATRTLQGATS